MFVNCLNFWMPLYVTTHGLRVYWILWPHLAPPLLLESSSKGVSNRRAVRVEAAALVTGPSALDAGWPVGNGHMFQFVTNVKDFGQPLLQHVSEMHFQQCQICSHWPANRIFEISANSLLSVAFGIWRVRHN